MSKGELTSCTCQRIQGAFSNQAFFFFSAVSFFFFCCCWKKLIPPGGKGCSSFSTLHPCVSVLCVCGKFNLKWKVWLPLSLPIPPCVRVQLLFNQHKVYCACVCGCVFEMNACFFCGKGSVAFVAALLNECERWFISTNFMCKFNTL